MSEREYSVYWFDPDGGSHRERQFVTAGEAMEMAASLAHRPAAKIGIIRRVIVTDGGDLTVFEWRYGEGIVWPTKEHIEAAKRDTKQ